MQLGIFAKTFSRASVEEVYDAVAAQGLRYAQFNFACAGLPSMPEQIESPLLDRIRTAAAERGVALAAVSATFNMIHPDARQRHDGLRRFGVIAAAVPKLGASVVTLCTGTRDPDNMWRHHPENASPGAWNDLLSTMTDALAIATHHDLTLCIEPETGNVISSARAARRLLDKMKSPRLKIIMDPANLFHPGELPRMKAVMNEAFDLLGADIVLAHAKELGFDGHAGSLPPGAGALDWDHYLGLLRAAGFGGPLIMHGFEEKDAKASIQFLRGKTAPAGTPALL